MYEEIGKQLKEQFAQHPKSELPNFAEALKVLRKEKSPFPDKPISILELSQLTTIKPETLHSIENGSSKNPPGLCAQRGGCLTARMPSPAPAGLRFKKHGGVHAAFGEHFSKTKLLDPKYHRWLLEAFNKRVSADYEVEMILTPDDVKTMIRQAEEFLLAVQRHLGA